MTKHEAMDAYIDALNKRDGGSEESRLRVQNALAALKPFMEGGRLPDDLHQHAKGKIKGQPQ